MTKSLYGLKAAILLANGFLEQDMIALQRAFVQNGASVRIVSPENGLVNSWNGQAWGHHFAVDTVLSTALAADFDALIVPGGQRSLDKLKLTAHSKRFMTSFMLAEKPIVMSNDSISLLIFAEQMQGRVVNGPADMENVVTMAQGEWRNETPCFDSNLMTGVLDKDNAETFAAKAVAHVVTLRESDGGAAQAA